MDSATIQTILVALADYKDRCKESQKYAFELRLHNSQQCKDDSVKYTAYWQGRLDAVIEAEKNVINYAVIGG